MQSRLRMLSSGQTSSDLQSGRLWRILLDSWRPLSMKICRRCAQEFSTYAKIGGQIRNLSKRKYCLTCSPFGSRNTRKLERPLVWNCQSCGRKLRTTRRRICPNCFEKRRRRRMSALLERVFGEKCWRCGFGVGPGSYRMLCLHHLDPSNKDFSLKINGVTNRRWTLVTEELRKCVYLCPNCHSEYHIMGRIPDAEMVRIFEEGWRSALPRLEAETAKSYTRA